MIRLLTPAAMLCQPVDESGGREKSEGRDTVYVDSIAVVSKLTSVGGGGVGGRTVHKV